MHPDRPQPATLPVDPHSTPAPVTETPSLGVPPPPPPDASSTPPTGRRYRVAQFHARGGLGEVFVADDPELSRRVALKAIRPDRADHPAHRARFLREATVTARLEHPGVVPVYGLDADPDGRPLYAMRFVEGETLADAVRRFHHADSPVADRGLELRRLLARFVAVCQTVAYAHAKGVTHRDLKPANILLGPFGETLVVDWGLARVADDPVDPAADTADLDAPPPDARTRTGAVLGTPAYMAPEQAAGERAGPAADVYALGAILAAILTGRPPVEGASTSALLDRVRRGSVVPPRRVNRAVPRPLEAICLKALARDPSARYPTAADLAADVERWLADEPVTAYREPFRARARRWARRHRTAVVGLIVLLMAAVPLSAAIAAVSDRARRRAEADQKRVEAEQQEADRQRNLALANLDTADDAVNRFTVQVTTDQLLTSPGMQPLSQKLLGMARDYYRELADRYEGDPRMRGRLARSLSALGNVTVELGDLPAARDQLARAEALQAALRAEVPDDRQHAIDLATTRTRLGSLERRALRPAEARGHYAAALADWDGAVAADPGNQRPRLSRAVAREGLAGALLDLGKTSDARAELGRATADLDALVAAAPDNRDYRFARAAAYEKASQADRRLNQFPAADGDLATAQVDVDHLTAGGARDLAADNLKASVLISRGSLYLFWQPPDEKRRARAGEILSEAVALRERLSRENPAAVTFHQDLLLAYALQARAAGRDPARARQALEAGIARGAELAARFPDAPALAVQVASLRGDLGQVELQAGNRDKAAALWRAAADECHALLARLPGDEGLRAAHFKTHGQLGSLLLQMNKPDAAIPVLKRAIETAAPWVTASAPGPQTNHLALAQLCGNLGLLLKDRKQPAEAVRAFDTGIAAVRPLVERPPAGAPALPSPKFTLFLLHHSRADALEELKRYPEALADRDEAVRLAPDSERAKVRLRRAVTRFRAGQDEAAEREVNEVLAGDATGAALYDAACAFAIAAGRGGARGDGYLARGIDLLRKAKAAGFFADRANREHLRADEDFAGIRTRPEFRAFLTELEAPKKE